MDKKLKNILLFVLVFLNILAAALPVTASSTGGSLRAVYKDGDVPISGADFQAYHVAGQYLQGKYSLQEEFSGSGIKLEGQVDNAEWRESGRVLLEYISQNNIQPDFEGTTDESGVMAFQSMEPGLYLLSGQPVQAGSSTYTPQASWVEISEGKISYTEPKFDKHTDPGPGEEIPTGNLEVSKRVVGNAASIDDEFSFHVSLSGSYTVEGETVDASSIEGTFGDMEFKDGEASFTLKHGQSVTASGLPSELLFKVEETDAKDYTTTYEGAEGVIPVNATARAAVTNTKNIPENGNNNEVGPGQGSGNSTPGAQQKGDGSSPVKTSDNSQFNFWFSLLSAACAAVCTVILYRTRRRVSR